LTALVQSPALPVIGVEEPELTVHPGALPMLYDYLRQASEVSQVFVTTHSPIILDVVDVENDVVFVVNRVDGKTDVQKITGRQLEPVRKSLLRLGDLFMSGDLQPSLFDDMSWRK
jgi:predicted ATPase